MLFALLFSIPVSLSAQAAPFHFYYSIAETDSPTWDYVFPDCKKLSAVEYAKVQHECARVNSVSEKCATDKTVNLKKVASAKEVPAAAATDAGGTTAPSATPVAVASPVPKTDLNVQKMDETTKTFKIAYMIFVSEKQCRETREAAMKPITK